MARRMRTRAWGVKIFKIGRVVGQIVRIPEQNESTNRFCRTWQANRQRGERQQWGIKSGTLQSKSVEVGHVPTCTPRSAAWWGHETGGRGNMHLRARRTEFEVVCEQASKYALAWPSESFLFFLISIFFFFPLACFYSYFPFLSVSLACTFFLQNRDPISEGLQPSILPPPYRFDTFNWNHREQSSSRISNW